MTDINLEAIEERENAATSGPWEAAVNEYSEPLVKVGKELEHVIDFMINDRARGHADAQFIAHARTDIPALVAKVRDQQEIIAGLDDDVDSLVAKVRDQQEIIEIIDRLEAQVQELRKALEGDD